MRLVKLILSFIYLLLISVRNFLYETGLLKTYNFDTPIISIGNITVGGNGKTPMTMYIANKLIEKKYRVGIISRGYKKKNKGTIIVSNGNELLSSAIFSGDEAYLMAKKIRKAYVISDENKVRGTKIMIEKYKPNIILLDDGFQHRKINKKLDIILINSKIPISSYKLLPYGLLREPISNIDKADMIITTYGSELSININKNGPIYNSDMKFSIKKEYEGKLIPCEIEDEKLLAFCGIANANLFINEVQKMNLKISEKLIFIDHVAYSKNLISKICTIMKNKKIDSLITTEKDFVKLPRNFLDKISLYVLCMEVNFDKNINFIDKLLNSIK